MSDLIYWLIGIVLVAGLSPFAWKALRLIGRQPQVSLPEVIATSRVLFDLVVNLQQHRGMSSAWLSGDASFAARLRDKQAAIDSLLPALQRDARAEGERHAPCFTGNEVALFVFRWRSLVDALAGKTPEQSIAEHSQLISQLLNWLAAVGEARLEPLLDRADQVGTVRNFAYRLPALAECLGQMRAIGSSVAARQACSPVARVRLMFLVSKVEGLLEQALRASSAGQSSPRARSAIVELIGLVRSSILAGDGIKVSPEQYFGVATRAVDAVVAWVGESGQALERVSPQAPGGLTLLPG